MKKKIIKLLTTIFVFSFFAFGLTSCQLLELVTSSLNMSSQNIEQSSNAPPNSDNPNDDSSDNTPSHEHSYATDVTAPTCTEQGYTTYTCTCGENYIGDYVNALGHTEVMDNPVPPTCTETGLTEGKHCSVCKEVLTKQEIVKENGHTEVIDNAVFPTCTETGLTEGKHCSVCKEVLTKQEIVKENGHTEVIDEAVSPTCTETGVTEGKHCSVCKEVLTKQEIVKENGHTESEWIIDKEATVTEDGARHQVCTACDVTLKEEVIHATGSLGLIYTINADENTYTVTGIGTCTDTDIVIPSYYNNHKVIAIGEKAFYSNKTITSIRLSPIVTSIEKNAFQACSNMKTVYYTGTIADWCGITFASSYSNPVYYAKDLKMLNENSAFTSVTKIVIPDTVTEIGKYQFMYFTNITDVVMGDSVTLIDSQAFQYCSSLVNITLSKNLTKVGSSSGVAVFSSSKALKNVYFRGTMKDWCNITFFSANATPMNLASNFYILGNNGNYSIVTQITIPNTVTKIGSWQFYGFDNLTKVTMPDSVETINQYAFMNCKKLANVTLSNQLKHIYLGAFYACAMKSITLPETLETIGSKAFQECAKLTSIVIPSKIEKIETYAFFECTSLTSVVIPVSVTNIEDYAFNLCSKLANVYYMGTEEQWSKITITSRNAVLLALTPTYNYVLPSTVLE